MSFYLTLLTDSSIYVLSAVGTTVVALIVATIFTVKRLRNIENEVSASAKTTASGQTSSASDKKNPVGDHSSKNKKDKHIDTSLMTGDWPTEENSKSGGTTKEKTDQRDPMEFCEHIPGEVKRVTHKQMQEKIEADMSAEQRAREREVQRQQMEAIFNLLKEQEEKFGIKDMSDMQDQMNLYSLS